MPTYNTPGVYVEEISTLPPSVVEVSTAIPAFVGFTDRVPEAQLRPVRIRTLLEYKELFGGPALAEFKVVATGVGGNPAIESVTRTKTPACLLYYAMSHFFANGGGSCFVSTAGTYAQSGESSLKKQSDALARLEQEDEPTLLVLTDAVSLNAADNFALCDQALAQCKKLGDRFSILDVPGLPSSASISAFRNGITQHLSYGAAYTPYLQTSIAYAYDPERIIVQTGESAVFPNALEVRYSEPPPRVAIVTGMETSFAFSAHDNVLTVAVASGATGQDVIAAWNALEANPAKDAGFKLTTSGGSLISAGNYAVGSGGTLVEQQAFEVTYAGAPAVNIEIGAAIGIAATSTTLTLTVPAGTSGAAVVKAWDAWKKRNDTLGFDVVQDGTGEAKLAAGQTPIKARTYTLTELKSVNTALYYLVQAALTEERVVLPPSAAVAGIYASVDRDRGVWKAPANVAIAAVIGPVEKITDEEQGGLNVDPTSGKSINALRAFTGKGTLVWGSRTLDGNSNEWRYVPVRRLFLMIEESAKKASAFAVFEPNVITTWLKVKGMIDSFLYGLWERGALAGSKPEEAYFVNVGLGKTMTPEDVLEGRMKVAIGVAAVRPAEFIVLQFTHLMQEA